jgi:hypothetical protein
MLTTKIERRRQYPRCPRSLRSAPSRSVARRLVTASGGVLFGTAAPIQAGVPRTRQARSRHCDVARRNRRRRSNPKILGGGRQFGTDNSATPSRLYRRAPRAQKLGSVATWAASTCTGTKIPEKFAPGPRLSSAYSAEARPREATTSKGHAHELHPHSKTTNRWANNHGLGVGRFGP